MSSRGKSETRYLISNVEDQLTRLLAQLQDLEDLKDDLDDGEYDEVKAETLKQLKEFQATLTKMMSGDVGLVDKLGTMQLAIQAAVSDAFKNSDVLQAFARKEPGHLRQRLDELKAAVKLGKMSRDQMLGQAVEILAALKKLGEPLTPQEESFLSEHMTKSMADFEAASSEVGSAGASSVLKAAGSNIRQAQKNE